MQKTIPNLENILKKIHLPRINCEKVAKQICDFIVSQTLIAGKSGCVLGLSGGVDSSLVAYLTKSAFDQHNSRNKKKLTLYGYSLPSKANSKQDRKHVELVTKNLSIEYEEKRIEPILAIFGDILGGAVESDYNRGNLGSEVRAVMLSRYATAKNCLILGTGNRDEDYGLGYFTKRGDGAVDINPIGNLSKRLVLELAEYVGVPDEILTKKSSAGLWKGQTDEGELGFTYLEAEIVIAGYNQGLSGKQIQKITNFGYVKKKDEENVRVVDKILEMHKKNKFKTEKIQTAHISLEYENVKDWTNLIF